MSKPSITFDEQSGKATPTRGVGQAAIDLITKYNGLIDSIALLQEPDVIAHLLKGGNAQEHPQSIQNAIAGIRRLLDDRMVKTVASNNEKMQTALNELREELDAVAAGLREELVKKSQTHQAAIAELGETHTRDLDAKTTQLTEEHDEFLDGLREEHRKELTAQEQRFGEALREKDEQILIANSGRDLLTRGDAYTQDVFDTVNQLFAGKALEGQYGIHPTGIRTFQGDRVHSSFNIAGVNVAVTTRTTEDGIQGDRIRVTTTKESKLPQINTVHLDLRRGAERTGLTPMGRTQLVEAIRSLTPRWFKFMERCSTPEELAAIYHDPTAAAIYFHGQALGDGFTVLTIRNLGLGNEEDSGTCPVHNPKPSGDANQAKALGDLWANYIPSARQSARPHTGPTSLGVFDTYGENNRAGNAGPSKIEYEEPPQVDPYVAIGDFPAQNERMSNPDQAFTATDAADTTNTTEGE